MSFYLEFPLVYHDKNTQKSILEKLKPLFNTYFSDSIDHWQVSQAHGPEQVEDLGDAGVG